MGPDGINANIICPLAWTAQLENFQQAYPEAFEANVKMPPAGHYGDVEKEIGRVCVQLASPDFKYMNGETLTLEGWNGIKAVTRPAEDRMYFLPLASFYISYMEKCGDIRLIDRLRIFMLFAILFCSLTLTDYSSSSSSSTHWAYPVLYVDVFSSSVLISESVFTSASEISASFSAVSDTFYQTLLLDSYIY